MQNQKNFASLFYVIKRNIYIRNIRLIESELTVKVNAQFQNRSEMCVSFQAHNALLFLQLLGVTARLRSLTKSADT